MSAIVHFHRLAAREYREARARYVKRSIPTTLRFIQSAQIALREIGEKPEIWPFYDEHHRWVKLKKFPYLLIFRVIGGKQVIVVAIAHTSRRPGYWRRRMI